MKNVARNLLDPRVLLLFCYSSGGCFHCYRCELEFYSSVLLEYKHFCSQKIVVYEVH